MSLVSLPGVHVRQAEDEGKPDADAEAGRHPEGPGQAVSSSAYPAALQ